MDDVNLSERIYKLADIVAKTPGITLDSVINEYDLTDLAMQAERYERVIEVAFENVMGEQPESSLNRVE